MASVIASLCVGVDEYNAFMKNKLNNATNSRKTAVPKDLKNILFANFRYFSVTFVLA